MKVYCPYCEKLVDYQVEKREIKEFKNVVVDSYENVAFCKECSNELYVNDIEEENIKRLSLSYRKNANIISADDIITFRSKYGISQRELSNIFGFGKMTINRYERGDVPTKSQSDYIRFMINNPNEFINKVNEAFNENRITERTFNKVVNKSPDLNEDLFNKLVKDILNESLCLEPNIYNGYKELNLNKVENIVSYVASKVKNLSITSINKYLWYIDMISFKRFCVSVTGLVYQKDKFGPTILDNRYKEISMLDNKYVREDIETDLGTVTNIKSRNNFDLSDFSKDEINVIDYVIDLLKDKKVTDISNMSHREKAWINTNRFDKISFDYAMDLNVD